MITIEEADLKALQMKNFKRNLGLSLEQLVLKEPILSLQFFFRSTASERSQLLKAETRRLIELGDKLSGVCDRCGSLGKYIIFQGHLYGNFMLDHNLYCWGCANEIADRLDKRFFEFAIRSAWLSPLRASQQVIIKGIRELAGLNGSVTKARAELFFQKLARIP
ncbi:MAG TPA: hypothetical protein PKX21_00975 [Candidatus Pacearchaeota archaeon]|nr:hypothetical protein [Candidatus Pacearchaeota archaeon]